MSILLKLFKDKFIISSIIVALGSLVVYLFTSIRPYLEIFLFILILLIFIFVTLGMTRISYKDLIKSKSTDNSNLFDWSQDLDGSHNLLNHLLGGIPSKGILDNVENISAELRNHCNNEIRKMRLLRAYYEAVDQHNVKQLYYGGILTIFVTSVSVLVKTMLTNNDNSSFVPALLSISPFAFLCIGILFLLFLIYNMTLGRYRVKLVINILDVLVIEEEDIKNDAKPK